MRTTKASPSEADIGNLNELHWKWQKKEWLYQIHSENCITHEYSRSGATFMGGCKEWDWCPKESSMPEVEKQHKLKYPKLKDCLKNRRILKRCKEIQAACEVKISSFISSFPWLWFLYYVFDLDNISQDGFLEESQSIMHEKPWNDDTQIFKFIKCLIFIVEIGS